MDGLIIASLVLGVSFIIGCRFICIEIDKSTHIDNTKYDNCNHGWIYEKEEDCSTSMKGEDDE